MGSCFPFVKRKRRNNKEIFLIILGLDNAGKTTTTRSIKGSELYFGDYNSISPVSSDLVSPTIGFDRIEFAIDKFNINLYDLGGGRTIRDIWETYFAEIHGVIFVVDSTDADRLTECHSVLVKLLAHPSISGKPVLLLANKSDVTDALDEAEMISALQLDELVNEFRCPCRLERCCALLLSGGKLDKAIRLGLKWLLGYIDSDMANLEARIKIDVTRQNQEQALERAARRERVRLARERRERLEVQEQKNLDGDSTLEVTVGDATCDVNGVTSEEKIEEKPNHLTVIDLEKKIMNSTRHTDEDRQSTISRHSVPSSFGHEPEPILARESQFIPRLSTRSTTRPKLTPTPSLLKSSELRRQIELACSIDLEPIHKIPTPARETPKDSIQIVELDEAEQGDVPNVKNTITCSTVRHFEKIEPAGGVPRRPRARVMKSTTPGYSTKESGNSRNGSLTPRRPVSQSDSRKGGRLPLMVDPLYGVRKPSKTPESRKPVTPQFSSYLTLAPCIKRPSPLARIFTPNVNKLHPVKPNGCDDQCVQEKNTPPQNGT